MRLIDADALIAEMHNVILKDGEDRSTFYEAIQRQPAIDAVPVVRCKDCTYYEPDENGGNYGGCSFTYSLMPKDGYCSDGRKLKKRC